MIEPNASSPGERTAPLWSAHYGNEFATCEGAPAKLEVGKEATIEAGSHSFDWVRIRVEGLRRPLWSPRSLIFE